MTNYFIDHDAKEGQLSGTLTFTNGSTTVTGDGTAFTTELEVGDYIISDDETYGKEWYKVTNIVSDTELEIDHAFYQDTHSSTASYNKQSNVTNGGTSATKSGDIGPFCHIQQFFDVAQAGDVGYVRRGKTYTVTKEKMSPVNDGSASSFIILMADDGTGWPDETGLDKPVISMDGKTLGDYTGQISLLGDYYWKIDGFVFDDVNLQSTSYWNGCIYLAANSIIQNCEAGANVSYENYKFIRAGTGFLKVINCTGPDGIGITLHLDKHAVIELENCYINYLQASGDYITIWKLRNCSFTGTTITVQGVAYILSSGILDHTSTSYHDWEIHMEDGDNHASVYYGGRVEKDATNYTGNASDSIKVIPSSNCNSFEGAIKAFEWKITNVSAAEHTVTVYVKGSGWTTFPTADELYIEVEYYDESTGTHTATAKSSEVLDANDTWKAFTVTFTPAQDGDIYVRGYLKKYEDGAVVWFNGEVEIT